MHPIAINTRAVRPIFATPNPLLIAGVRSVLSAAGIPDDPRIVAPESLGETLASAEGGLVILDGQALPNREVLAQMCGTNPRSYFVVWATQPTADLLRIALECGVHGLLSTRLPLEEAAGILQRICQGERILRFDSDSSSLATHKPLQFTARERNVLLALAGGASNAGIAAELHTTASTIKGCLSRLFRKTGARNRRELAQLGQSMMQSAARSATQPKSEAEPPSFDESWMLEDS